MRALPFRSTVCPFLWQLEQIHLCLKLKVEEKGAGEPELGDWRLFAVAKISSGITPCDTKILHASNSTILNLSFMEMHCCSSLFVPVRKVTVIAAVTSICARVATKFHSFTIGCVPNDIWPLTHIWLIVELYQLIKCLRFPFCSYRFFGAITGTGIIEMWTVAGEEEATVLAEEMSDRIHNGVGEETSSVEKAASFIRPNFFLFFVIAKCTSVVIWTRLVLKRGFLRHCSCHNHLPVICVCKEEKDLDNLYDEAYYARVSKF